MIPLLQTRCENIYLLFSMRIFDPRTKEECVCFFPFDQQISLDDNFLIRSFF
jgi:hypothetical protein